MGADDLCFTPAVELARLIRRRTLSPVEIARAVLERIPRLNPALGAYVLVHAGRALEQARGAERAVMAGGPLRIAWPAALGVAPVEVETRDIAGAAARAFAEAGLTRCVGSSSATTCCSRRRLPAGVPARYRRPA